MSDFNIFERYEKEELERQKVLHKLKAMDVPEVIGSVLFPAEEEKE